ncbi:hypothetical protein K474DRAFT_1713370 [Panus rudis PR-1116 ss-1]|nr:hypothetical protein K474DRAFT_1713370 [Panus rudis PR-1116 ss-1]
MPALPHRTAITIPDTQQVLLPDISSSNVVIYHSFTYDQVYAYHLFERTRLRNHQFNPETDFFPGGFFTFASLWKEGDPNCPHQWSSYDYANGVVHPEGTLISLETLLPGFTSEDAEWADPVIRKRAPTILARVLVMSIRHSPIATISQTSSPTPVLPLVALVP